MGKAAKILMNVLKVTLVTRVGYAITWTGHMSAVARQVATVIPTAGLLRRSLRNTVQNGMNSATYAPASLVSPLVLQRLVIAQQQMWILPAALSVRFQTCVCISHQVLSTRIGRLGR